MTLRKSNTLTWDVFLSDPLPVVDDEVAPEEPPPNFPPISATLISGERDAVLVDPLMTFDQGRALAEWVAGTGKNLTMIYVTHGHGDHWFGLGMIRQRFPAARAFALPQVVDVMRVQASTEVLKHFWDPRFPGQIPHDVAVAETLADSSFELEGNELLAVNVGHTDTDATSILYAPSTGLLVAGDAVYNDVHLHLSESVGRKRDDWIAALDRIESLAPTHVVAGHKRRGRPDDPIIVDETRRYIRDFEKVSQRTTTARELYEEMRLRYPDRLNRGALWSSALAEKGPVAR